jgi:hypothetical protein
MGWPVLGYLLEKIFGGVIAIISFRLTWPAPARCQTGLSLSAACTNSEWLQG